MAHAHGPMLALLTLLLSLLPGRAHAFVTMIEHGYASCGSCHADPSGGGLLTEYGRGQAAILLHKSWTERPADWEPGPEKDFLFGALDLPDSVLMGISSRNNVLSVKSGDADRVTFPAIMQADARAQVSLGPVRAYGSLAWLPRKGQPAWLTNNEANNLGSREHWVGVDLTDGVLLRAGRIALPFGIRILEHPMWARQETRSDIDTEQQHGAAVAVNMGKHRAEIMGIAGNMQLSPAILREQGYSAFYELKLNNDLAVGVSSMMVDAELDRSRLEALARQAHGLMLRMVPVHETVLLAEANLLRNNTDSGTSTGHTGFVQVDRELAEHLRLALTGEWLQRPGSADLNTGAWVSSTWFFAPRMDLRVDAVHRWEPDEQGDTRLSQALLGHLHFFL
jgi:hypothetical protein